MQEMSIELSLEDVKKVAYHYGFEMEVNAVLLILHKSWGFFQIGTIFFVPYLQLCSTFFFPNFD